MIIRDKTSYSKTGSEKKLRIAEFKEEKSGICFTVHRHIDYPGTWLVSCGKYLDKINLKTDDFYEAAVKAKEKVTAVFRAKVAEMQTAIEELDNPCYDFEEKISKELGGKL